MLIAIGGHWLVSTLVTVSAAVWAVLYLRQHALPTWLPKILVVAILVRLAIPVITVGTDVLFRQFLEADYRTGQNFLEAGAANALKLSPKIVPPPENQGLLDKMKNMIPNLNISSRIDSFVKAAEQWPEQIIKLMVIFLLQTLIIPITLLWCLIAIAKRTLRFQYVTLPSSRSLIA